MPTTTQPRSLHEIAMEIARDWKKVSPYAKPYLDAMFALPSVHHNYGADSGKSVVLYFLANATTWRGDVARKVKKELNEMCK